MSEHLPDKRLNDLAALRDRGVLSEDEYQRARLRLLEGRSPPSPAEPDPRPFYYHWVVLTLASLAILALVIWLGVIRGGGSTETNSTEVSDLNDTAAPLPGPELCSSDPIYGQIADAVFNRAVQQFEGDPRPLTSLRRAVGVRMQYPVLRDVVARIDCSGRLVIDIPPEARDKFDGAAALQADVIYSIQPADEGGTLVELDGTDIIVQRLLAAATLLAEGRAAGALRSRGPSFACEGALTDVERVICQDEELSRRDRTLSDRFQQLRETLPTAAADRLAESHRRFLGRRNACPDVPCLLESYSEQLETLDRIADERPNEPRPI